LAKPEHRKEPVTVNFDPDKLASLRELAAQEERTLSGQVRHLVALGLEAAYEELK
jgi:hypothetical protein